MVTGESRPESLAGINCFENGLLKTSSSSQGKNHGGSNAIGSTNKSINYIIGKQEINSEAKQVVSMSKSFFERKGSGGMLSNRLGNKIRSPNHLFSSSMMKLFALALIFLTLVLSVFVIAQESLLSNNVTTTTTTTKTSSPITVNRDNIQQFSPNQAGFLEPPPNNDPTIVYGRIIHSGRSKKPCYRLPCDTSGDDQKSDNNFRRSFLRIQHSDNLPTFRTDNKDDDIVYATIDTGDRKIYPSRLLLSAATSTTTEGPPPPPITTTVATKEIPATTSEKLVPQTEEEKKARINHIVAPYPIQPDPNYYDNDIAITIDKVKGIEFPLSTMSKLRDSRRRQSSSHATSGRNTNKCSVNKYDLMIEKEMRAGTISVPIVNSDGRYGNPFPTWRKQSVMDIIQFMVQDSPRGPRDQIELDTNVPLLKPNFRVNNQQDSGDFRTTWIGHSTLLIQVDGYNILTDPMFSDRASPVQYVGPKRIREPACDIKSLPKIDIVLISHNHYDHLDSNSVKELNDRFGDQCRWIVPVGLGEYLDSMSVTNYAELNWWQKDCFQVSNYNSIIKKEFQNRPKVVTQRRSSLVLTKEQRERAMRKNNTELNIYFTPSQHWTRRGIADVNKSLWGSFTLVSGNGATFFFTGDTAYCKAFKEIGRIFGPFTGAAIPIGAYSPRWFLKTVHVDPLEAIQIHRDIRSNRSIAIHHATFILSKEHYLEPATLLRLESDNLKLKQPFTTIRHGESTEFCKDC